MFIGTFLAECSWQPWRETASLTHMEPQPQTIDSIGRCSCINNFYSPIMVLLLDPLPSQFMYRFDLFSFAGERTIETVHSVVEKRRCYICQKVGHLAIDCRHSKAQDHKISVAKRGTVFKLKFFRFWKDCFYKYITDPMWNICCRLIWERTLWLRSKYLLKVSICLHWICYRNFLSNSVFYNTDESFTEIFLVLCIGEFLWSVSL